MTPALFSNEGYRIGEARLRDRGNSFRPSRGNREGDRGVFGCFSVEMPIPERDISSLVGNPSSCIIFGVYRGSRFPREKRS